MNIKKPILILLIFVFLATIHLLIFNHNLKIKYVNESLKIKYQKLCSENRNLKVVVENKKSLERIEKIATQKLKMVRPNEINYIKVPTTEVR